MATATRTIRPQWLTRTLLHTPPKPRHQSTFANLETTMKARKIAPIFDDLTPTPSYRLNTTLADFLPSTTAPPYLPPTTEASPLPTAHHLIYFEPTKRGKDMLPDGTNPDQSPGEPFVRRMWAGSRVQYNQANPFVLDGSRGVCAEFIRGVTLKGQPGQERVFVTIERRQAKATPDEIARLGDAATLDHRVRQRLWRDNDSDFGPCSILETRSIVFMRARSREEAERDGKKAREKQLRPPHAPDWSCTVTPDAKLLFRFSALTFNAHAIHLDPEFCRDVEGHRALLFHGPLSYVFLVSLLQQRLGRETNEVIKLVEYRNLAPLYCHEPVTFCARKMGERKWEIWAQTPEGGVAVKGTVTTETGNIDRANLGV